MMDALIADAEVSGYRDHFSDKSLRTADEHVAPVQVRNQPEKLALAQAHLVATADQLVQLAAPLPDQFTYLLPEHEIFFAGCPQYDDRCAGPRQVLQQRPQRRDSDPGGNENRPRLLQGMLGEGAVGSLDRDPRAGPQPGQGSGVITDALDREPKVRCPGQGRDRIRVRLPPEVPGQEPPEEE